jgi:cathepsin B
MNQFLIITLIYSTINVTVQLPVISKEHIENLRQKASFEIFDFEEHPFKSLNLNELASKLGLLKTEQNSLSPVYYGNIDNTDLPETFDSKVKWENCIHPIRDQQNCGSCWAFAASEVLSDRLCIVSSGKIDTILSPEDFLRCDTRDLGCNGGYVDRSWNYLKATGIVSEDCLPYRSGDGIVLTCPFEYGIQACEGKGGYRKYKVSSHSQLTTIVKAKEALITYGPIEAAFYVYEDFFSYKGGVYRQASDEFSGEHAVKVIGWDKDDIGEYWIAANSWGEKWGEKGYFRIGFGECKFEHQLWAGIPQLPNLLLE